MQHFLTPIFERIRWWHSLDQIILKNLFVSSLPSKYRSLQKFSQTNQFHSLHYTVARNWANVLEKHRKFLIKVSVVTKDNTSIIPTKMSVAWKKTPDIMDIQYGQPFWADDTEKTIEARSSMAIVVSRTCQHCDSFLAYVDKLQQKRK